LLGNKAGRSCGGPPRPTPPNRLKPPPLWRRVPMKPMLPAAEPPKLPEAAAGWYGSNNQRFHVAEVELRSLGWAMDGVWSRQKAEIPDPLAEAALAAPGLKSAAPRKESAGPAVGVFWPLAARESWAWITAAVEISPAQVRTAKVKARRKVGARIEVPEWSMRFIGSDPGARIARNGLLCQSPIIKSIGNMNSRVPQLLPWRRNRGRSPGAGLLPQLFHRAKYSCMGHMRYSKKHVQAHCSEAFG